MSGPSACGLGVAVMRHLIEEGRLSDYICGLVTISMTVSMESILTSWLVEETQRRTRRRMTPCTLGQAYVSENATFTRLSLYSRTTNMTKNYFQLAPRSFVRGTAKHCSEMTLKMVLYFIPPQRRPSRIHHVTMKLNAGSLQEITPL